MSPGDSTVLVRALPKPLKLTLTEKRELRDFARQLAREVAAGHGFSCLITDDRELQALNWRFLAHDYATDVLSFPAPEGSAELGEMAISMERAEAQAREFGHSRIEEVRILMLHGLLHLTGMDHERDSGEMARTEEKWRSYFGLPGGLISRAMRTLEAGVTA